MGTTNKKRDYYLGDQLLPKTEEEKDLGVIITDNCKPTQQCSKAAAKAMSSLGLIRRSFKYIDQDSFSVLYRAYIRPHLEYCVQAWNLYMKGDIKALEKVQRRATKLVKNIRNRPYEERLRILKLYPLEARRMRGDLIEAFKILQGLENIKPEEFFTLSHNTGTRGHNLKLFKKRLSKGLELRKHFFSQRIVDKWNKLPLSVVSAETTNQFKNRLDKHWTKNGYGTLKG